MPKPFYLGVVDPGKCYVGLSYFENGVLVDAHLVKEATPLLVAAETEQWFLHQTSVLDVLLTEGQQVYPGPRRADPNDLLPLAFMCGACAAMVQAKSHVSVLPRIWTKGTPKEIRLNRLRADLSPEELKVGDFSVRRLTKAVAHNVWDSIAMGCWYLKEQNASK